MFMCRNEARKFKIFKPQNLLSLPFIPDHLQLFNMELWLRAFQEHAAIIQYHILLYHIIYCYYIIYSV